MIVWEAAIWTSWKKSRTRRRSLRKRSRNEKTTLTSGGYLIYLAIKMGRDYPGLAASGVWSSDRIIALCGAIAFSIIGAALLVITAVRSVREWKQDAQNEQEEHTDE